MAMIANLPKQSNKRRLSICNSLSIIGLAAFVIVFLAVIAEILRRQTSSLSHLQLTNSEVEKELNRVRLEAADLGDAVLRLQTLNEGLSQDKDELNQMLMRMEAEKGVILTEKSVIEQEKDGFRDELIHLKQEIMNRESEKKNAVCTVDLASYGYDDSTQCAHVRTSGGTSEEVLVRDKNNKQRNIQLGVTIIELDPKTCTTRNRQSFGTHFSSRVRNFLLESLQLKKEGTIIVGVTVDTPENEDNAAFKNVVGSFFSDYNMNLSELKFRGKFAFIMQKGYPEKTIFRSKPRYGKCLKMKLELRGSEDEDVSFRLINWT